MTTPAIPADRRAPRPDAERAGIDPVAVIRGLASLRRLTGMYPAGHPSIEQRVGELDAAVQRHLHGAPSLQIDVIHGVPHVDGAPFRSDGDSQAQALQELTDLGVNSLHIRSGVPRAELLALSEFLWQLKDAGGGDPIDVQLARRNIHHVSLGRLVALDTRWRAAQWPDAPTGDLDPAYAESLERTERTFEDVTAGKPIDPDTVAGIVQLLLRKVAGSSAALSQILAVKMYENLTYCHSVNVATLSLLIAKQLGFDEALTNAVGEAALLHDIGKTRIPLHVLRKPGALDRRERKLMEAHTTLGAEILVDTDGLRPLTPTVALEHHRTIEGSGYPDLGAGVVPHLLSQIVSVADIYEALTGARSYQEPAMPEQACLILARIAGTKLNTALVRAFVNAVTFFPIGSVVRTDRGELGIVTRTNTGEPLHPVVALVGQDHQRLAEIDTAARDSSGAYERHVIETLRPPEGLDVSRFLATEDGHASRKS